MNLFKAGDVGFQTALIAGEVSAIGIEEVYPYDRDLGRVEGVRAVTP